QIARIEGWRLSLQLGQRLEQIPAGLGEKNQKPKDQKNGKNIPSAEQAGPAANRNWDEYAHALDQLSETVVTKLSRNRERAGAGGHGFGDPTNTPDTAGPNSYCFLPHQNAKNDDVGLPPRPCHNPPFQRSSRLQYAYRTT